MSYPRTHLTNSGTWAESAFQELVINTAHAAGWRVAHFRTVQVQRRNGSTHFETPVAADGKGWPDLVLSRGAELLYRELKKDAGVLEADQKRWGDELRLAGADWAVWRPKDWPEVERRLWAPEPSRLTRAEAVCELLAPLFSGTHDGRPAVSLEPIRLAWAEWRQTAKGDQDGTK